ISVAVQQRIHPNVAVGFEVTESRPLTWYLPDSEDNSLYAAMLDYFNQLSQEDVLARLEEKYFGHVGSFDYFDTISFITAIDSVLPNYQPLFEKYADTFDWRLLAAMAWQESHWDPHATSPTGVRGLMMLTRPTASSMGVTDRLDPEESVRGGAQYLKHLLSRLPDSIPEDERIWFALAAYNIGFGHMLDARRLTEQQNADPDSWLDVKSRLPLLSQKKYYENLPYGYARGHEAYRYVENIRRYQLSLVGYLQAKESKNKILSKDQEDDEEQGSSPLTQDMAYQ
ncbi:murein transglycosylase, partial [Proteus mirabilis]